MPALLNNPANPAGRRGATEQGDYLIDRFRVRYRFGGGWMCACADFALSDACRHTREAAGRYAAQMGIAERITRGSLAGWSAKPAGPPGRALL